MAASTSEPKPCPQGISVKIPKVARWLQGPEASYFRVDHNLICVNREGLEEVAGDLVKSLLREISFSPTKQIITAIHFKNSVDFPIDDGWVVDLINLHAVEEITVGDFTLNVNCYVRMNRDTYISGNFYGLICAFRVGPKKTGGRRERMVKFLKSSFKIK